MVQSVDLGAWFSQLIGHIYCPLQEIMLYLTYDQLSWDFQPATEEGENFYSSLWLEFDSTLGQQKVSKRLQIFSRQVCQAFCSFFFLSLVAREVIFLVLLGSDDGCHDWKVCRRVE